MLSLDYCQVKISFHLSFKANLHSGLTSIQYNASNFTASIKSLLLLKSEHREVVVTNAAFFDLSRCEVFCEPIECILIFMSPLELSRSG